MSFRELAITITARNEASAEFIKVASEAAAMGENVRASASVMGAEFSRVGAEAIRMGGDVRGSAAGFTYLSEACNASAVSMSGAVVQSHEFTVSLGEVKDASEGTAVSIRTVASTLTTFAGLSTAVISLAGDLGIVDKESAKWARTMLSIITITSTWIRLKSYLTTITAGHTAATALNTTVQSANASASIASALAHKIHAAASWVATAAQNALNISYATFLALTGVGLAVIAAAAVAMWSFASSMNAATSSVKEYNAAVSETPTRTRGIIRAGEEEMYRRGVE